jgi:hypothetical protein
LKSFDSSVPPSLWTSPPTKCRVEYWMVFIDGGRRDSSYQPLYRDEQHMGSISYVLENLVHYVSTWANEILRTRFRRSWKCRGLLQAP